MNKEDNTLEDLTRSVLNEETPNQNLIQLTALVICAGFILFIVWSSFTNVNEVARAQGEIIPNGYSQTVQHLEGGIVADILIEEGDLVEEGEILVSMGGIGARQDFSALEKRQLTLELQAERLRALAYDRKANFSKVSGVDEDGIEYQKQILRSTRDAFNLEKKVLMDQLSQKEQVIARLEGEKQTANKELKAGQELLNMKEQLSKNGTVSRKDLIDSQRDVNRLEGEVRSITAQISEAEKAISEFEYRLQTLSAKTKDDALKELEEVETQISQNKETLLKLKERVDRQSVRAPVRGLVKDLRVNSIGGVIGAGQPIMEIVPLDSSLIVEVRIKPREIGNLKVGQPARVKVSAYDFSRYGVVEGELTFISAATFVDNDETFYKGRIKLSQNYVGKDPKRNLILPGMVVEADVITGQKTILSYLLKPIHLSLDTAFRER
tara:strand:- start:1336 stop:2649 length:1314 start_codon:yes stop_codon:yes gene_type:complete